MVTSKDLKKYGFRNLEAYFISTCENQIFGNITTTNKMALKLSIEQRRLFGRWLFDNERTTGLKKEDMQTLILKLI